MASKTIDIKNRDSNPDLITGEPGSHPVGTGLGGKDVAEVVDPTGEDKYWRAAHGKQPCAAGGKHTYENYAPAYRTGYEGHSRYETAARFEEAEPTLREGYLSLAGEAGAAKLPWEQAKAAAEHAWNRVERGEAVRIQLSEEQLKVGSARSKAAPFGCAKSFAPRSSINPSNCGVKKSSSSASRPARPARFPTTRLWKARSACRSSARKPWSKRRRLLSAKCG